jgi:hypothetical protein
MPALPRSPVGPRPQARRRRLWLACAGLFVVAVLGSLLGTGVRPREASQVLLHGVAAPAESGVMAAATAQAAAVLAAVKASTASAVARRGSPAAEATAQEVDLLDAAGAAEHAMQEPGTAPGATAAQPEAERQQQVAAPAAEHVLAPVAQAAAPAAAAQGVVQKTPTTAPQAAAAEAVAAAPVKEAAPAAESGPDAVVQARAAAGPDAALAAMAASENQTAAAPVARAEGAAGQLPPSPPPGVPKVALMFLTRGPMPHEQLWGEWLSEVQGKVAMPVVSVQCGGGAGHAGAVLRPASPATCPCQAHSINVQHCSALARYTAVSPTLPAHPLSHVIMLLPAAAAAASVFLH